VGRSHRRIFHFIVHVCLGRENYGILMHTVLLNNGNRLRIVMVTVKCTLVQALRLSTCRTAHRGSRGIALPFHDHGYRRGWGSASRPGRSLPPGKTRYPLYRRLDRSQGRSGQVRKISPPSGFDPRTVQPVASRYIDYATRPTGSSSAPLKNTRGIGLTLQTDAYCAVPDCTSFPPSLT
jgi:hypothetical protein